MPGVIVTSVRPCYCCLCSHICCLCAYPTGPGRWTVDGPVAQRIVRRHAHSIASKTGYISVCFSPDIHFHLSLLSCIPSQADSSRVAASVPSPTAHTVRHTANHRFPAANRSRFNASAHQPRAGACVATVIPTRPSSAMLHVIKSSNVWSNLEQKGVKFWTRCKHPSGGTRRQPVPAVCFVVAWWRGLGKRKGRTCVRHGLRVRTGFTERLNKRKEWRR
ncbi:hypothetical protein IWZ03DRAFT_371719, partial [Phyllosticta citriasiana]